MQRIFITSIKHFSCSPGNYIFLMHPQPPATSPALHSIPAPARNTTAVRHCPRRGALLYSLHGKVSWSNTREALQIWWCSFGVRAHSSSPTQSHLLPPRAERGKQDLSEHSPAKSGDNSWPLLTSTPLLNVHFVCLGLHRVWTISLLSMPFPLSIAFLHRFIALI